MRLFKTDAMALPATTWRATAISVSATQGPGEWDATTHMTTLKGGMTVAVVSPAITGSASGMRALDSMPLAVSVNLAGNGCSIVKKSMDQDSTVKTIRAESMENVVTSFRSTTPASTPRILHLLDTSVNVTDVSYKFQCF